MRLGFLSPVNNLGIKKPSVAEGIGDIVVVAVPPWLPRCGRAWALLRVSMTQPQAVRTLLSSPAGTSRVGMMWLASLLIC